MIRNVRKAVGASVSAMALVGSLGISPAIATEPCDVVLNAVVDGSHTTGDLELTAAQSSEGWTYAVTVPFGYDLKWLDGTFGVTDGSGFVLGGGQLVRSASIDGNFVHISGCFVERRHSRSFVLV